MFDGRSTIMSAICAHPTVNQLIYNRFNSTLTEYVKGDDVSVRI